MNDITLVILAAGMGSRFGGLKQVASLGPNGEFIIDYSIYDAVKAGFSKVVFIIKKENYELFKETIGSRVEPHIKVSYCFQENNNIPDKYEEYKTRVKPLGTAHAILCANDYVNEPFAIINADDYYGTDAFLKAASFLKKEVNEKIEHYGMVGYNVGNTITNNGSVKRGVCEVKNNILTKLIESSISKNGNELVASPLNGTPSFKVEEDTPVSMNMFLFKPSIFNYIEEGLISFLEDNKDSFEKSEYLIPDVVFKLIKDKKIIVDVLSTSSIWYGVTYKEDSDYVKENLKRLHDNCIYPKKLW